MNFLDILLSIHDATLDFRNNKGYQSNIVRINVENLTIKNVIILFNILNYLTVNICIFIKNLVSRYSDDIYSKVISFINNYTFINNYISKFR